MAGQKEKTTLQSILIAPHLDMNPIFHCTAEIVLYCTVLNIIVQHCTKATTMLQCTALLYVLLQFPHEHHTVCTVICALCCAMYLTLHSLSLKLFSATIDLET